ncbi:hypothetical protein N9Y92_02460 [Chlamydiales bacterium]|nr:hypothetical protein [Chlamydiales bacterium]
MESSYHESNFGITPYRSIWQTLYWFVFKNGVVFFILTLMIAFYSFESYTQHQELVALEKQRFYILQEIESLKKDKIYYEMEINSFSEDETMELVLMRRLGVVPKGYKKVLFR